MSEIDTFFRLPDWGAEDGRAGGENAQHLAEFALQRPIATQVVRNVERVGICGAGIMGSGIAAANIQHQIPVWIYDAAPAAIERTVEQLVQQCGAAARDLVSVCESLDELAGCDLVIETVVENCELKQQILGQLAEKLPPQATLSTNTSTIPIGVLAEPISQADRLCGLHFCNPVSERRLVEIVRGPLTNDQTIAAAVHYVSRIGKLPVVVRDSPGFLVNRVLLPYLNEALDMICQGANLKSLDKAARAFGMALGPIELFDTIGIDTAMWAGRTLWEAFPDRIDLTPVLPALVKRNRLGRKQGVGFYRYDDPQDGAVFDPTVSPILAPYIRNRRDFADEEIALRLFLPMLVEATRVIQEQVIEDVRDVDIGLLYGLAFPESRGGLLYWADRLGPAVIVELLNRFQALGKRMHPTPLLHRMAREDGRFYEPMDECRAGA